MNDPAFPLEPHAFSPTARSEGPGSVALLTPTFFSLAGAIVRARGLHGKSADSKVQPTDPPIRFPFRSLPIRYETKFRK